MLFGAAVYLWEGRQLSSSPQDDVPEEHTRVRRLGSIKRKHLIHQMTMGTSER